MSKTSGRVLLTVCLATAAWSFSFGLGTQAITLWLKAQEANDRDIGLNHSIYYLGLALASLAVPWLTRRLGNHCAAWGMIFSGLCLALFPWGGGWVGWFVLRFLNGMSGAMSLVPLETLISRESAPERRAHNFSFYGVALALGGAIGIWAGLHCYRANNVLAFYLGGLFPVGAGLFLFWILPCSIGECSPQLPKEPLDWGRNFLSYGTAWFQGLLEGGMLAFLCLYLISIGMSPDSAGDLMGVTMIGVIVFQVPVAWLADRFGRLRVLLGCYGIVAAGLALVPIWQPSIGLGVCLFLLGACSGALYPLALALLGDRLPPTALARAYAWFLAMECIGSQMGSALMGEARFWYGEASMFVVGLVALAGVLGLWIILAWARRETTTFGVPQSVPPKP